MTGLDDLGYDLHDYVRELTRPHVHREPYSVRREATTWTSNHTTRVPALIDQLCNATPAGGEKLGGSGSSKPMPPAHLEALDVLADIDKQASRWVRDLGRDDPVDRVDGRGLTVRGSGAKACVLILGSLYAGFDPQRDKATARTLEHDVRRWWTWARIASGWDSAAWRPDNTCPVCSVRGVLRVRLSTGSALCIECRATWDPHSIGLLAEHIREENREDEVAS